MDLGDGEFNLGFENVFLPSLNDGKWHSIDIIRIGRVSPLGDDLFAIGNVITT